MTVARFLSLGALALACGGDADPCADAAGACLAVRVDSDIAGEIDQLELDILYGDRHATTSTQADGGRAVSLPVVAAIQVDVAGLDVEPGAALEVGVVAAGKLGGLLVGTGAGSAAVADGARADIDITLAPVQECTPGGHYCGGDQLAGDPGTLYTCVEDSVPQARGACTAGCRVVAADDDVCRAEGGPCVEGGLYCGGDKLEGDPATLYTCEGGAGVGGTRCPDGCLVRPGRDDACR